MKKLLLFLLLISINGFCQLTGTEKFWISSDAYLLPLQASQTQKVNGLATFDKIGADYYYNGKIDFYKKIKDIGYKNGDITVWGKLVIEDTGSEIVPDSTYYSDVPFQKDTCYQVPYIRRYTIQQKVIIDTLNIEVIKQ